MVRVGWGRVRLVFLCCRSDGEARPRDPGRCLYANGSVGVIKDEEMAVLCGGNLRVHFPGAALTITNDYYLVHVCARPASELSILKKCWLC